MTHEGKAMEGSYKARTGGGAVLTPFRKSPNVRSLSPVTTSHQSTSLNPSLSSPQTYVHRRVEDQWFEAQDLRVVEVLPQMVALSEAYLQVFERRRG